MNDSIRRYRHWYAKLLRLHSKPYYARFGEGMEQTFNDLLRERAEKERGVFGCALWMFVETSAGIMREHMAAIITQNIIGKWVTVAAIILLLPLLAMLITDEVVWGPVDFAVAGALIVGTGSMYELAARKAGDMTYRAAAGVALATALVLVWANLAVGIIGSEDNPGNLMYVGVLAVGIIGALIARFQPHGMARVLFATAIAQALVAAIALMAGMHQDPGSSVSEILNVNGFFVALWVGSALLFLRASATDSKWNRPA